MLGGCLPKQSWLVAVPSRPFNLSESYHCSQVFWFFFLLPMVSEPKGLAAFVCGLQGHCSFGVLQGAGRLGLVSRGSGRVKLSSAAGF